MKTLPDNLQHPTFDTLATLSAIVREQTQWLVQQQPKRAADNFETIIATFQHARQHVQQQMQAQLAEHWPAIPCSSAEFDPARQANNAAPIYWVCDPIDGAVQYLAGLPLWTTSLCLVVKDRPVLALVHYPAGDRMFHAHSNHGAYCNGQSIRVANRSQLELAMIGTSFPNYPQRPAIEIDDFLARLGRVIPRVLAQRWMGPASLTLSQLACGMLDGYWETGGSLHDWLAGMLIAQEAGAQVSDLDGRPLDWQSRGMIVASPPIYPQLAGILSNP